MLKTVRNQIEYIFIIVSEVEWRELPADTFLREVSDNVFLCFETGRKLI